MQQDIATPRSIEGRDGHALTIGLDVGDRYTTSASSVAATRWCESGASAPRRRR